AHRAALDAGDTGLFLDPFYATYPGTIRGAGALAQPVPCAPEAGFMPRAADIAKAAQAASRPRSLLINTPNNPTGVVYDRETLEGIARACRDHGLWLISDEVYEGQVWAGRHLSPRALPHMSERTLVIGSMSKSHAMTGSRVGWIVGPAPVIEHLINLATHTTYGVPGYIQEAAAFALALGPAFEDEISAPFRRRREIGARLIAGQSIVGLVPSGGAMYLMLDIRRTGLSATEFAQSLLDHEEIAVMPGESFGRAAQGHLRVAMTVDDAAFEAALSRLLAHAAQVKERAA
ncbi:MAG: pyridoxal phosphate-dependent aminotransferase, partial [Pseudomonadota bacterium]